MIEKLHARDIAPFWAAIWNGLVAADAVPNYFANPNPSHFAAAWEHLVSNDIGVFYGGWADREPAGLICGVVAPDSISGEVVGHENLWVVLPKARSGGLAFRLMERFEADAKAAGASSVAFGCSGEMEKMVRMYARRGYRPSEILFRKKL